MSFQAVSVSCSYCFTSSVQKYYITSITLDQRIFHDDARRFPSKICSLLVMKMTFLHASFKMSDGANVRYAGRKLYIRNKSSRICRIKSSEETNRQSIVVNALCRSDSTI